MPNTDGGAREQLVEQLTELHRLVRLGARASGRQGEDSTVRSYPEAEASVQEMRGRLEEHAEALGRRLSALGHTPDGRADGADGPPENPARPSEALGGTRSSCSGSRWPTCACARRPSPSGIARRWSWPTAATATPST